MINRLSKILLFTLVFVCIFLYCVSASTLKDYTLISGTFEEIPGGIYTRSAMQSMVIKNELLYEGKISAEFSSNVKEAQYPVGIVFAGKGIREYQNISGSNIFYLRAYFSRGNIVLDKNEHGIDASIKSASVDTSFFESDTVTLSVSFTSDGLVEIFVNDNEVISITLSPRLLYGGELGICAGGDGNEYEITDIVATNLAHTEHTAGNIIPETSANCINDGKKEHSICTVCGELIYKEDGIWTVATEDELTIPKDSNNHVDSEKSVEWTYDEAGHTKSCRCGEVFLSENHDIAKDALEGRCTVCSYNKIHICDDFTRVYATLASCVTKGKKEHYKCNDCSKLYIISGNSYIEKTESELEEQTDPDNHIDSVDILKWTYDDSKHYKICRCGEILSSGKHDISANALQGKCSTCAYERSHTCTYTEIPEIPADCMTKGRKEHYKCEACKKLYIKSGDAYTEISVSDLETPKNPLNHIDSASALEWTYDESGHKKVCRCKTVLAFEEHDIDVDALEGVCSVCGYVKTHTCTYTKISEVAANCVSSGQKLHYKCNDCGKLYIKNNGVYTEVVENDLITPKDTSNHVDSVRNLTWTYDDRSHTKTCRCGTVLTTGKHSISESALNGTCATCGYIRTHVCTYTEVPEVKADCMTKGKIAHYKCEACKKLYIKDGENYTRIYTADLDTPKDSSNHVDGVNTLPWTHDEEAHKKTCRCGEVLAFEEHDIDPDALEGVCSVCRYVKTHICTYTKIPEIEANCISKGQKLHYKCSDCGKLYIKNNGIYTEIIEKELEIPEDISNHVDSVKNLTWTYDDRSHTKTCRCGTVLATGKHSISDSALSGTCATCGYIRTHVCTYTEVPEVKADCMTKGKIAHYKCEACKKLYIKNGENYTRIYTADLDTPKDSSNHVDSVGSLDWSYDKTSHKKTCRCGKVLNSAAHDIPTDALEGVCSIYPYVKTHTCTYTKISKVAANCVSSGQKLHYKCNDCGKLYIKNNGIYTEIIEKELEIPEDISNHVDSVRNLTWTYDDHAHTKTCRCGTVLATNNHTISSTALSGTCTTCGYVRTHTCTYTEIPEVAADCMTKGKMAHYKCEACKKLYIKDGEKYIRIYTADLDTPKNASNHIDSESSLDWIQDEGGHKKVCRCKAVLAFEEHDIDADALEGVCTVCGYIKNHTCTYEKISKVAANCISGGRKLHYKCNDCGKLYIKNNGVYTEISEGELEVPKDTSNHIDSVRNLTWTYDDYSHTKTCRCGAVLATNNHTISETALSGTCRTCGYVRTHTCTYTEIPEVKADCMTKGRIAHYKCEACKKLYIKDGEKYIRIYTADLDTPKDTSNHVDSIDILPWDFDENTHKKTCRCGRVLISEAHDISPDSLFGTCSICSYEKSHICEYTYVSPQPADCTTDGMKAHYKCLFCGKIYLIYQDKYVEISIEDITVKASHTLEKFDSTPGSCITESRGEYYKCEICEKLFSDEKAENEIENIPKGEKDFENHIDADRDGKCDLCLHGDAKQESKPQYYILLIVMPTILILCVAFVIVSRKLSGK